MRLETDEKGNIILKEVFSGLTLETADGEKLSICMRDSGFEFEYSGHHMSAQKGKLQNLNGFLQANGETHNWKIYCGFFSLKFRGDESKAEAFRHQKEVSLNSKEGRTDLIVFKEII